MNVFSSGICALEKESSLFKIKLHIVQSENTEIRETLAILSLK
jgi:hypothetical protein